MQIKLKDAFTLVKQNQMDLSCVQITFLKQKKQKESRANIHQQKWKHFSCHLKNCMPPSISSANYRGLLLYGTKRVNHSNTVILHELLQPLNQSPSEISQDCYLGAKSEADPRKKKICIKNKLIIAVSDSDLLDTERNPGQAGGFQEVPRSALM